tara:strand:+ start:3167 stop:3892 length:726 start_codon:yes stop_codon:yes gene_type:complete
MIFILLPAFNEEKNLKIIFKKISKNFKNKKKILVVLIDDCSDDNTNMIKLKKFNFKIIYEKHKKNMGLNIAMETGLKLINKKAKLNDIIISLDSDNTHPISLIPKMVKKINKGNDIVIASRFVKGSRVSGLSSWRKMMSILAKLIFKVFYPFKNLNDYTCNYRAYRAQYIKKVLNNKNFFKNEDFNIAAKILLFLITNNRNLKLAEVPLSLRYDLKIGNSKMKIFRTIFLTLRLIFIRKFN